MRRDVKLGRNVCKAVCGRDVTHSAHFVSGGDPHQNMTSCLLKLDRYAKTCKIPWNLCVCVARKQYHDLLALCFFLNQDNLCWHILSNKRSRVRRPKARTLLGSDRLAVRKRRWILHIMGLSELKKYIIKKWSALNRLEELFRIRKTNVWSLLGGRSFSRQSYNRTRLCKLASFFFNLK